MPRRLHNDQEATVFLANGQFFSRSALTSIRAHAPQAHPGTGHQNYLAEQITTHINFSKFLDVHVLQTVGYNGTMAELMEALFVQDTF